MRAMWKGTISFGLVTVPVKLYTATESREVELHQVHREDGGRIRYRRVCELDGKEVLYSDIAKGYELPDGSNLVLDDDDLAGLPLTTARTIEVVAFAPASDLEGMLPAKLYYVGPEDAGKRAYGLLAEALASTDRVAVVRVALRQRESLAVLRAREDGVLTLETLLWPDEIRQPASSMLDGVPETDPAELNAALALVDAMAADFDPADYHDQYREALQELVEAKTAGTAIAKPQAVTDGGTALLDALTASVAARSKPQRSRKRPAAAKPKGKAA